MSEGKDYRDFDYGDPVAKWFVEEAFKLTDTGDLVQQAGEQLVAAGIPLYRLSYIQAVDHPEMVGTAYFWRRGKDVEQFSAARYSAASEEVQDSPVGQAMFEGKTMRFRLEGEEELPYQILADLKQEGATDYVILPVTFGDGHHDALSVTSDVPGGFSREDLDRMYVWQKLFARIVEIHSLRRRAVTLLDVYVGHKAGERILNGQYLRGDGDTIHAVIWYCDMRGFSQLSEQLERDELITLLNDYFECMGTPVTAHGGEIIKFIGDAMLAIFRIGDGDDTKRISETVLVAAQQAFERLEEVNIERRRNLKVEIDCGLALHVGDVMFGNIGAPGRLDFTVIGPAVNRVTRVAELCGTLNTKLLVTTRFAALVPDLVSPMGSFALKGSDGAEELFAIHGSSGTAGKSELETGQGSVDLSVLHGYTGADRALETEVLTLFMDNGRRYIEIIRRADGDEDWRTAAHSLKGSARSIGAHSVAERAARVEQSEPGNDGARAVATGELVAAFELAAAYLDRYLAERQPDQVDGNP